MKCSLLPVALLALACSSVQSPRPLAPPAAAESTRRYDFILGPGKAGFETVTIRGNERDVHFEYNDRGRGPKTDSVIVVEDRSFPRSLSTTGNDYYKASITEALSMTNGTLAWSNGS